VRFIVSPQKGQLLNACWLYYLIGAAVVGDLVVEVASAGRRVPVANWFGASAMVALALSPLLIFGPLTPAVVGQVLLLAGGLGAAVDLPLSVVRNWRMGRAAGPAIWEALVRAVLGVALLAAYSGGRDTQSAWGTIG
jgi:hypothetical protein